MHYTATALANIILTLSPQCIILGGSVRKAGALGEAVFFVRLREAGRESLNGYIASSAILESIDRYLVAPTLDDAAGLCGAARLAQRLPGDVA
ncbi:ROK family protein [Uliginosibacterium sp. H3]|uniref:ROK family protein n=1 Tax=Uliginosibacterium silvisoli TaxID=3114758 RepID=A0ABU6K080_9RHOO|nr:ROK family protein [Uliginosibacterium sp. H3]